MTKEIKEIQYHALDISKWIINKFIELEDPVSKLKLQKLLYYVQGCSLAMHNKVVFNESIEAWRHGPVVREVFNEYKHLNTHEISDLQKFDTEIDPKTKSLMLEVIDVYGGFSAWKLRDMTHEDKCWKNNYDKTIPINQIKKDFADKVEY